MDFALDDDARSLRKLCRDFATKEIAPKAHQWSEDHVFPSEVFRKMGELGLMGLLVDEEYGGAEAGFTAYVAAMEEIGNADQSVASTWNAHSTIGSLPLARFGTAGQKERWLRPLAEGRRIGAFGLTEPEAGSDAASIKTTAVRRDGGWVINGTKMFITNAGTDMSLGVSLLAVTGEADGSGGSRRYGTFLVPDGTEGYRKGEQLSKLGWNASDTRELVFDDCWVSDDHLIGDEGNGLRQFLEVLDPGRISVAALSLSLARAALEMAVQYANERVQFGRPLRDLQVIQHKIADMSTAVDAARMLVYRAAWLADNGHPFSEAAAKAKLYASEVANQVASQSLQIHGGYGYMKESRIARFYSDAKILEIGEGANEIQRNIIGRSVAKNLEKSASSPII